MDQACSGGPEGVCQVAVLQAIDHAREAEGVEPLILTPGYDSLSTADQLLVLTDLERVDRGLPGFSRLSPQLDSLAQKAALSNSDPYGPAGATWGSNWAGGEASALLADYDWMYDDGPGSPNLDCHSASASGCWDHRRNILGDYGRYPSMGAAAKMVRGMTSMTELLSSAPIGTGALPKAGRVALIGHCGDATSGGPMLPTTPVPHAGTILGSAFLTVARVFRLLRC
jgi:hypothetical protein